MIAVKTLFVNSLLCHHNLLVMKEYYFVIATELFFQQGPSYSFVFLETTACLDGIF